MIGIESNGAKSRYPILQHFEHDFAVNVEFITELAEKGNVGAKDDCIDEPLRAAKYDVQEVHPEILSLRVDRNDDIVDRRPEPHKDDYGWIKPEAHERVFLVCAREIAYFARLVSDDDIDSDIEDHRNPEEAIKLKKPPIRNFNPTPSKSGSIEIANQSDHRESCWDSPTKDVIEFFERTCGLLAEHGVIETETDACCPEDAAQLKNVQQDCLNLTEDA